MSFTVPTREDYDAVLVYLQAMVRLKDWHGVADAALDLRVMEALNPELLDELPQKRNE